MKSNLNRIDKIYLFIAWFLLPDRLVNQCIVKGWLTR